MQPSMLHRRPVPRRTLPNQYKKCASGGQTTQLTTGIITRHTTDMLSRARGALPNASFCCERSHHRDRSALHPFHRYLPR